MRLSLKRLKHRYYTAFLILRLLLPVFITVMVLLLLASGGILYSIIHPPKTLEVIDPADYHMFASDFTWDGAREDVMQGWYIRGSNQAPLIILCHGYQTNRSEVLSLASRLRDYGYNIFVYNQRGHGSAGQKISSLGYYETEDLRQAIDKLIQRPEIDFNRIGIYGCSLGAYTALRASQGVPNVRVLVLDSVYPSISVFIDMNVQRVVGFRTSLLNYLVTLLYKLYFRPPSDLVDSDVRPKDFQDKTILFITGRDRDSLLLAKETRRLYSDFTCRKEIINLANSRESLLFGEDKRRYDQFLVDFFRKELPLIEEPVKIDLANPPR